MAATAGVASLVVGGETLRLAASTAADPGRRSLQEHPALPLAFSPRQRRRRPRGPGLACYAASSEDGAHDAAGRNDLPRDERNGGANTLAPSLSDHADNHQASSVLCLQALDNLSPDRTSDGASTSHRSAPRNSTRRTRTVMGHYWSVVRQVNAWEEHMKSLSDTELRGKTDEFRSRVQAGETLDSVLPEAFAAVREASWRVRRMRHFDVQIMGGAVLHDGRVAEMCTGEGKTLVATLPAYLNSLMGLGVHVLTVNEYLAERDSDWMGAIFEFLGVSVGLLKSTLTAEERQAAYAKDVTYGTAMELGFDFLRDNLGRFPTELVLRRNCKFHYALVDEVDSILIDDSKDPMLISVQGTDVQTKVEQACNLVNQFKGRPQHPEGAMDEMDLDTIDEVDYTYDLSKKHVELLDRGMHTAERLLCLPQGEDLWSQSDSWAKYIIAALRAQSCYRKDIDYIVQDGQVQIINANTGRAEPGRRYNEGLHAAIEAKEGLKIRNTSKTSAAITHQVLFREYTKLCGMTGTASTEEQELRTVYGLEVVQIPTNKPNRRIDLPTHVFALREGKWRGVIKEVTDIHDEGRPVLVGTASVADSMLLSKKLRWAGIPHKVLNALPENMAREAEIIAQAGRPGAVTIATNMAGRGTDIILGGNPEGLARKLLYWELRNVIFGAQLGVDEQIDADDARMLYACSALLERAKKTVIIDFRLSDEANRAWVDVKKRTLDLQYLLETTPDVVAAYRMLLQKYRARCQRDQQSVLDMGGLHVLGTELQHSRRIDNQLRGRAGRQGDPGSTHFLISMEDEVVINALPKAMPTMVGGLIKDDAVSLPILEAQLTNVQSKWEAWYRQDRQRNYEHDLVLDVHRRQIYQLREANLLDDEVSRRARLYRFMQQGVDEIVVQHASARTHPSQWDLARVLVSVADIGSTNSILRNGTIFCVADISNEDNKRNRTWIPIISVEELQQRLELGSRARTWFDWSYESKRRVACGEFTTLPKDATEVERELLQHRTSYREQHSLGSGKWAVDLERLRTFLGEAVAHEYEQLIMYLKAADEYEFNSVGDFECFAPSDCTNEAWSHHLEMMSRLRNTASIRAYGELDPLEEFSMESYAAFMQMWPRLRDNIVENVFFFARFLKVHHINKLASAHNSSTHKALAMLENVAGLNGHQKRPPLHEDTQQEQQHEPLSPALTDGQG
eukprot:jgi/Chlat1/8915/Chrsp92S08222